MPSCTTFRELEELLAPKVMEWLAKTKGIDNIKELSESEISLYVREFMQVA